MTVEGGHQSSQYEQNQIISKEGPKLAVICFII